MRDRAALGVALAVATIAAYGSFAGFEFVNWDDNSYVTSNAHVKAGLTLESLRWVITATDAHNWHPLTWLSHMLDVELFGLDAAWHHRVNLLLHVATTLLLFLAFVRMTGAAGRSAFVAGLFALHPLHVESVAWIAERKDVLSGLCFAGTLYLYARYAEQPSRGRYAAVVAVFAAGLCAKPMLVTLPGVVLLLDLWPLRRRGLHALVLEKLPLLALSAISSVITVVAQRDAIGLASHLTLAERLGNSLVSYVRYCAGTLYPVDLSISYTHPGAWSTGVLVACALLLAGVTIATLRLLPTRPWFAVGWLWYLGMLVPVIGLVQVGEQAMADRYMYLPSIGLFVMAAWGIPPLVPKFSGRDRVLAVGAIAVLALCGWLTRAQVQHWRNSTALWEHAHAVDPRDSLAMEMLGRLAQSQGRANEAIASLREAVRLEPRFALAWEGLGYAYRDLGDERLSLEAFQKSAELDPSVADTQYNLGVALLRSGLPRQALAPFGEALRLRPDFTLSLVGLGDAHAALGDRDSALVAFERALELARAQGAALLEQQIESHLAQLRGASIR